MRAKPLTGWRSSAALVGLGLSLWALQSQAATDTFVFNLPAVGNQAVQPPYPDVATLTLSDVAGGVQFTLTPNTTSSGFSGDPNTEFVERLDLAYSGTGALTLNNVSGAAVEQMAFSANPNMDAGYSSQAQVLSFNWYSSPQDGGLRFDVTESSTWSVLGGGVSVASFSNTFASANNKPGPTHGILSVTGYDLDVQPTPSNWVTGAAVSAVPEAQTYAFMLGGLAALGALARRRSRS